MSQHARTEAAKAAAGLSRLTLSGLQQRAVVGGASGEELVAARPWDSDPPTKLFLGPEKYSPGEFTIRNISQSPGR
jgi:hypothetical protein